MTMIKMMVVVVVDTLALISRGCFVVEGYSSCTILHSNMIRKLTNIGKLLFQIWREELEVMKSNCLNF